jgi:type IV pilus assembly protein PilA
MLEFFHKRMKDDRGFTLIELMVVVLIIAILIAIAIPTFLGLRRRAQDRAAQSDLRNGLTAAKAYFTDDETYVAFDAAAGETIEPSLTWVDGAVGTAPRQVGIKLVSADQLVLEAYSASGTTFCIADDVTGADAGTYTGTGVETTVAGCNEGW